MIVSKLEELETTIKEKLEKNFASYINKLPEVVRDYMLYQIDIDPQGLFVKLFLLSMAVGEPNTNHTDLMDMWGVTGEQFKKYEQELFKEGFLDNETKNLL